MGAPNWTVKDDRRPDRGLRPRRVVAAGLVRPARPAPDADADADLERTAAERQRVGRAAVTATYLERLAARTASVGSVLCLGLDPDPTALPPGFSADIAGVERFAMLIVEAAGPFAAAVKPNLAFFEAFGSDGMAALERIRAGSRPRSRSSSTPSAATSARPRPPGGRAVRPARRGRRDRQPVPGRPGDRAAARAPGPLRLRPVPDLEPRCRRVPEPRGRGRPVDRRAGRAAPPAGRPTRRELGTGRHGRAGRRGDRPGRAARDPGGRAGSRLPRPGDRRPGRGDRAGPARWSGDGTAGRGGSRSGASSSTSRAASPRPPSASPGRAVRATPASVSRRPPATGLRASLCYPSPRTSGPPHASVRASETGPHLAGAPTIMPTPGPLELVIILVIALLILGPGKLPDVGAALGKSIREFRKASSDVQDAVKVDVDTSPLPTPARSTAPGRLPSPRRPRLPRRRQWRSPRPSIRPRPRSSHRASRPTMADADALRESGPPALPVTPAPEPPPPAPPPGRLGHVARRPPRRAATRLFRSILAVVAGAPSSASTSRRRSATSSSSRFRPTASRSSGSATPS